MTGHDLRTLRLSLGLTQTQLAHTLGYEHYQRIHEMENKTVIGKQAMWRLRAVGLVEKAQSK